MRPARGDYLGPARPAPSQRVGGAAAAFGREFPGVLLILHGGDPDNVRAILSQLAYHLREWPGMARRLGRVSFLRDDEEDWGWAVAYAYDPGDGGAYEVAFRAAWFARDRDMADDIATHEAGHLIDFWLRQQDDCPIREFEATLFLLGLAPTPYGATQPKEAWAEGLRLLEHSPRVRWPDYSRFQDRFLAAWR